jgi:hypothetical protein
MLRRHSRIVSYVFTALFVALLPVSASSAPSPKLELIQADSSMPQHGDGHLVVHGLNEKPFRVAESRAALQAHKLITLELSEIPKAPRLEVIMTVVTYACATKPGLPQGQTRILINRKAVAEWSFAYRDQGKSYRTAFDIDPKLLRVGENKLEIIGYRCSYGNFEVVRFHGIALTK